MDVLEKITEIISDSPESISGEQLAGWLMNCLKEDFSEMFSCDGEIVYEKSGKIMRPYGKWYELHHFPDEWMIFWELPCMELHGEILIVRRGSPDQPFRAIPARRIDLELDENLTAYLNTIWLLS